LDQVSSFATFLSYFSIFLIIFLQPQLLLHPFFNMNFLEAFFFPSPLNL
jgi:hypothetical protein